MDEDEYVAKVEKIIERDFFPELDKLKAQVERGVGFMFLDVDVYPAWCRATTLMRGRGRITRP